MKPLKEEQILKQAFEEALKNEFADVPDAFEEEHRFSEKFIIKMSETISRQKSIIFIFKKLGTRRIAAAAVALVTVALSFLIAYKIPLRAPTESPSVSSIGTSSEKSKKPKDNSSSSKKDSSSIASSKKDESRQPPREDKDSSLKIESFKEPEPEETQTESFSTKLFLSNSKDIFKVAGEGTEDLLSKDILNARWNDLLEATSPAEQKKLQIAVGDLQLELTALPFENYRYRERLSALRGSEFTDFTLPAPFTDRLKLYKIKGRTNLQYFIMEYASLPYLAKTTAIPQASYLSHTVIFGEIYGLISKSDISEIKALSLSSDYTLKNTSVSKSDFGKLFSAFEVDSDLSAEVLIEQGAVALMLELKNASPVVLTYYPYSSILLNEFGGAVYLEGESKSVIESVFGIQKTFSEPTSSAASPSQMEESSSEASQIESSSNDSSLNSSAF